MRMSFLELMEQTELLQKLRNAGHGKLIDALLTHDVYTKAGKLNKSAAIRKLRWTQKQLLDALAKCKELLEGDVIDTVG